MDTAFLETAWLWSRIAVAAFGVLTAVAVVFALTMASRLATARQSELERLTTEMRAAIETAEAKVAEAEQQAALARAAAEEALQKAQENAAAAAPPAPTPSTHAPVVQTPPVRTPAVQRPAVETDPPAPTSGVSNRHLTSQQRLTLVSLLRAATEPRVVQLSWVATNESYAFATEIRTALLDAGWKAHLTGGTLGPSLPAGILLSASVLSDDTVVLPSAFHAVGVQVRVTVDQSMPTDLVRLTIGSAETRR